MMNMMDENKLSVPLQLYLLDVDYVISSADCVLFQVPLPVRASFWRYR